MSISNIITGAVSSSGYCDSRNPEVWDRLLPFPTSKQQKEMN